MFLHLDQPAISTVHATGPVSASEMATQSAMPGAGDEREAADPPATYEEMFPYLMLAMVTAI